MPARRRSRPARSVARTLVPLVVPALLGAQERAATLDTVRVTVGSRTAPALARTARSVDVITRDELARAPGQRLVDVLATRMGVDVTQRSAASADLAVRGGSFEQVLVLVDGVRVSDQQSGHFDLDLAVPFGLVERIEILRGTGSTLYGADAVGGVVNIVTRQGSGGGSGALRAGSFGTVGAALAGAVTPGRARVYGGADVERSDGHRAGTDYQVVQLRGGVRHPAAGGALRAEVGVGRRDFGAADFYGPYPSYEETRSGTGLLGWDGPVRGAWTLQATATARRHDDEFTLRRADPAFYQNTHRSWQLGGEVVARHAPAAGGPGVAVGASWDDLRLTSERLGGRRERRSAVFAEATVQRAGGASANGGVRVDWSSEHGVFASPTVGAVLPVGRALALRASAARGFRAPTWTERHYRDPANEGTPTLAPETFWAGELGLRAAPAATVRLDVALWARRAEELIDWARPRGAPATTPWRTLNVERATFRGVELEARAFGWLGADWRAFASGTDVDAAAVGEFEGKYALRPLVRTLGAEASVPLGERVRVTVVGREARRVGEPGHVLADLRAEYVVRGVRFGVDALNLGGAGYRDAAAMPAAGRALHVSVRWDGR